MIEVSLRSNYSQILTYYFHSVIKLRSEESNSVMQYISVASELRPKPKPISINVIAIRMRRLTATSSTLYLQMKSR